MTNKFLESLEANTQGSLARRVRRRLPDIETALAAGFTHRQILEQLNRDGIALTLAYYHRLVTRLRSEARASQGTLEGAPARATVPQAEQGIGEVAPGPAAPAEAQTSPRTSATSPRAAEKSADLSVAIAAPTVARPRTISVGKPSGPKFKWDPKGAEKIDPDNI